MSFRIWKKEFLIKLETEVVVVVVARILETVVANAVAFVVKVS